MASLSSDILSNLSTGSINQVPIVQGPTAAEMYRSGSNISIPPIDAVNLSVKRTTTIDTLTFPGDRPKFYVAIEILGYHRFDGHGAGMFQVSRMDHQNSIIMPLPQMLTDANMVTYDQAELTLAGGGAGQILANSRNAMNNAQNATSGITQSVTDNAPLAAGLGAAAVGGAVTGFIANRTGIPTSLTRSLGTNAARLAGYTPNQFLTILLKGPAYKKHSLRWLVSPHNPQEAKNLQQIINVINNAKAPGVTAGGAIFTFPSVFRVSIMPNSQFMYKFKPAVVESFTVDYTGGTGIPNFKRSSISGLGQDYPPGLLQIELNLLELEFWLNQNYSDDNDPNNVSTGTP